MGKDKGPLPKSENTPKQNTIVHCDPDNRACNERKAGETKVQSSVPIKH